MDIDFPHLTEAYAALGALPMFFVDMGEYLAAMAAQGGGAPTIESMMMMGKQLLEAPEIKEVLFKLLPKLMYQGSLDP